MAQERVQIATGIIRGIGLQKRVQPPFDLRDVDNAGRRLRRRYGIRPGSGAGSGLGHPRDGFSAGIPPLDCDLPGFPGPRMAGHAGGNSRRSSLRLPADRHIRRRTAFPRDDSLSFHAGRSHARLIVPHLLAALPDFPVATPGRPGLRRLGSGSCKGLTLRHHGRHRRDRRRGPGTVFGLFRRRGLSLGLDGSLKRSPADCRLVHQTVGISSLRGPLRVCPGHLRGFVVSRQGW